MRVITAVMAFGFAAVVGAAPNAEVRRQALTSGGGMHTKGHWQHCGSLGELACSPATASNGYQNFPGSLRFTLAVFQRDLDHDGLDDAFDADNDGDGISDIREITGSAFWPQTATDANRADSDADGVIDGNEAVSGTDPQDADRAFRITSIQSTASGGIVLTWEARQGRTYLVRWFPDPRDSAAPLAVATATADGTPDGVWQVVVGSVVDPGAATRASGGFYRVELVP